MGIALGSHIHTYIIYLGTNIVSTIFATGSRKALYGSVYGIVNNIFQYLHYYDVPNVRNDKLTFRSYGKLILRDIVFKYCIIDDC